MKNTSKEIVPVAVSTDENYSVPTYIMLHSMMKNARKTCQYKVFILVEKTFSDHFQKFIMSLENDFDNIAINFVNMGDSFSDSKMIIRHTTTPSMYRLLLPDILSEYERCIYADVDTIVCGDIAELMDIDLEDNYVAGVRDIEADKYIESFDYGNIKPPTDTYINTGLLVMNLRKMREANMVEQFMNLSHEKLLFMDQDILNICCSEHILPLSLKYNAMVKYRFVNFRMSKYQDFVTKVFPIKDIHEAYDAPVMVHYAQPLKPWQCAYVYKGKIWYNYIKKNISDVIEKEFIKPFVKSQQKGIKIQINNFIRYVLCKLGVYKYLLVAKGLL